MRVGRSADRLTTNQSFDRGVDPFIRDLFCSGSGSLARVTLQFLCGLNFRDVLVFRYESAME